MSRDAVLNIFDDLKQRVLNIDQQNQARDGIVFSMMQTGQPVRASDFRDPWSPYDVAALDVIAADASDEARDKANQAALERASAIRSAANLSSFVNRRVRLNERYEVQSSNGLIEDCWGTIIHTAGIAVAAPALTAAAQDRLHQAESVVRQPRPGRPGLVDPTPQYQSYLEYKKLYEDACLARNAAYADAMRTAPGTNAWPQSGRVWNSRVDTARDQWDSLGFRRDVEAALDTINAKGQDAAAYFLKRARTEFDAWQMAAGMFNTTVAYTQCFPSDWAEPIAGDSGWTAYHYGEADEKNHHSSSASSWSGGGGVSFGFWSVGGSGGSSSRSEHTDFNADSITLEMKYGLVMIDRPWLRTGLLNVAGWGLPGQEKFTISDGSSVQNQARDGANALTWLPCLPTHMLVVKEVRIKSSSVQRFYDEQVRTSGGGASVGWGPFSLGGSTSSNSTDVTSSSHMEDGWLVVDGAQVIGFLLEVMPKSPAESMVAAAAPPEPQ